ncbi:MAG: FKBP-type peptidyl-prolyl cis-trans isomerase [Nocardioidaceae bacterium]
MRKHIAALVVLPLLLATAACGGSDSKEDSSSTLPGVKVTGTFGEIPTVTAKDVTVDKAVSAESIEGDGPEIDLAKGALVHFSVFSGVDGTKIGSTLDSNQPQQISSSGQEPIKGLNDALKGAHRGSRVVLVEDATDAVGADVLKQLDMKDGDSLIAVTDIISVAPADPLSGPKGTTKKQPAGTPKVVEKNGKVTGFDWKGVGAKPTKLQVITLVEGDGPAIQANRLATFNYLGEVWKGKKPFDESYSEEPITFPVGSGSLISAWDQGLIGIKQGSRVMIIAPPDTAYGDQKTGGIPANSTLVFVLDVLGVDS